MHKIKTLVVGATGYVGRTFFEKAKEISETIGTSSRGGCGLLALKFEDISSFDFELITPGMYVYILAAISAPDVCAKEYDRAWSINVTGTSEFIEKALAQGARVMFFSSDAVYGEKTDQCDESAICNPLGEYGVMKRAVEEKFIDHPEFKTLRLSYVFSKEDKFSRYLSACAAKNEEAELFHPFFRSVVHRDDVIAGALLLARRWNEFPQKIINFGGPDVISRIDMALHLKEVALHGLEFRVTEPAADFFKSRPRSIAMNSPVLPLLLGRPILSFAEAAQIEFCEDKHKG